MQTMQTPRTQMSLATTDQIDSSWPCSQFSRNSLHRFAKDSAARYE
jgi:hypothetical protein